MNNATEIGVRHFFSTWALFRGGVCALWSVSVQSVLYYDITIRLTHYTGYVIMVLPGIILMTRIFGKDDLLANGIFLWVTYLI